MHLLVLILWSVLLPQAFTLQCYQCPEGLGSCTAKVTCSTVGALCGIKRVSTYKGAERTDVYIPTCVDQCAVDASLNFGIGKFLLTSKCCSTDDCNIPELFANDLPTTQGPPNGRTCHICDGVGLDCTGTLSCLGDEDRCASLIFKLGEGKGTGTVNARGCASAAMCQAGTIIGTDVHCCQGDMCNNDAFPLQCYQCFGELGSCTTTVTCPTVGAQCEIMRFAAYKGAERPHNVYAQTCVDQCAVDASLNFGTGKLLLTSKCCSTHECNIPGLLGNDLTTTQAPNGRTCHTCVGVDCTGTLSCLGDEDHCVSLISKEGKGKGDKGCASRAICQGRTGEAIAGALAGVVESVSCCQGDLCNNNDDKLNNGTLGSSAGRAGFSLLLLVASVTSVLFL